MTAMDDEAIAAAYSAAQEFGPEATFRVYGARSYDPRKGETIEAGKADRVHRILPPQNYDTRYIDGDVIHADDAKTYLPTHGVEFEPVHGMEVFMNGEKWSIVRVRPIVSGEETAMWELQLRR